MESPRAPKLRCGLVTTTCVLGLSKIYLYIHDAACSGGTGLREEVEAAFRARGVPPSVEVLAALVVERPLKASGRASDAAAVDVVALQERDVVDAIDRSKGDGIDWLFHFDDDELLHLTTGRRGPAVLADALALAPRGAFNLRLDNLEVQKATKPMDSAYNFFAEERRFKVRVAMHADSSSVVQRQHDARFFVAGGNPATGGDGLTAPYLSYWNGKSAGRVHEAGLRPCGVHYFAAERGDAATAKLAQWRSDDLLLLHFPFCHFYTWRHKFNVLDATQRSDWGHYRDARLAIVAALSTAAADPAAGEAAEAAIAAFYKRTVMLLPQDDGAAAAAASSSAGKEGGEEEEEEEDNLAALALPRTLQSGPQNWRSGLYRKVHGQGADSASSYELIRPRSGPKEDDNNNTPPSYLYRRPNEGTWLVGSTAGAATGAAVAHDGATEPWDIASTWSVFDGAVWVDAPGVHVGRVVERRDGKRFAYIDATRVLSPPPPTTTTATEQGQAAVLARATPAHPQTRNEEGEESPTSSARETEAPARGGGRRLQRHHPDHARLAALILSALASHGPYRRSFWAAVAVAVRRAGPQNHHHDHGGGSPTFLASAAAAQRALHAGARAMGATPVAAQLVAERLGRTDRQVERIKQALDVHLKGAVSSSPLAAPAFARFDPSADAVYLAMGGDDDLSSSSSSSAQAWRAGLYVAAPMTKRGPASLYRRVRERANEAESYLFTMPARHMWLVGSTPGSTTGGLVAYDEAVRPQDIKANWHAYDGSGWVPAVGVAISPVVNPAPLKKNNMPTDRPKPAN